MKLQPEDRWHEFSIEEFTDLAQEYGTPFFLYDADAVSDRIRLIHESMERLVEVFYAVKANPNLELLRAIRGVADGLDVSSRGELDQALLAGYDAAAISFAGPAKTSDELATSIERGVGHISIESMRELLECVSIAKRVGRKACVVVRVNPKALNRSYGMKMGGKPVQFGVDEEEIAGLADTIRANTEHLDFRGMHVYAGSQCFEVAGVVEDVENTLRIVDEFEASTGLKCETINLGGGFGVSHGPNRQELNIQELARELVPILRFRESSRVKRRVVFELGRFLTANAGMYVTRVVSSKKSRGQMFFIVDGGLHHHLSAAGTFGTALRTNFVLRNLSRPHAPMVRCNVAGASCNPTDLLGVGVEIPRPEHGDLIAVLKSGSYGFTASPLLFLGRETPAELVRRDGAVVLGRRRRTIVDFN